jgi:pimeloyl-ACP methyl ester carboxylesterase
MATRHPHAGKPSLLSSMLEARAFFEIAALPCSLPLLMHAPQGDGHPVLLLPGFMGSEGSLIALEVYLRNRGYAVQTWGLGRNVGFRPGHASAIEQKIRYMHHESGRKVSLVGWSLGGVFAMYGAHQASECVRSVVTLGSPITVDASGTAVPPLLRALYRLIAHPMGAAAHSMQPRAKNLRESKLLPMPVSCLYSLSDGVVPPQEATMEGDPSRHENVRVWGSHTGLGFNPLVLQIVADRLAQPEDQWQPYRPSGVSGRLNQALTHAALPI